MLSWMTVQHHSSLQIECMRYCMQRYDAAAVTAPRRLPDSAKSQFVADSDPVAILHQATLTADVKIL